jgi:8-oxo-dGTP pyrophosphatase MutT (NUDIX family)
MRVVGCFLEYDNKFVLLRRPSHKPDGNSWGLPAGKVEDNEADTAAAIRELFEETGHKATPEQLEFLDEHQFSMPSGQVNDFVCFRVKIDMPHEITLESNSHSEYRWASAKEASEMDDLIFGLLEVFRRVNLV